MVEKFFLSLRGRLADLTSSEGTGFAIALVLIFLVLLLARQQRHQARGSVLLLILSILGFGMAELFESESMVRQSFRLCGLFLLLCSIGRSLFLLITARLLPLVLRSWPQIFLDVIQGLVYFGAFIITLRAAGADPASLLTGSALLTAVIGLSLRDTLGNLFAGLAIQAQRPFEVGDWIQFDNQGTIGQVVEINWRTTRVITNDAVEICVPNAVLGLNQITNLSRPVPHVRRSIHVHAPAEASPDRVRKILLEAVADAPGVEKEPPPSVLTWAFDERGVQYWVRFFTVNIQGRDTVESEVRDRIWYAFHRHGLLFPVPRRNVALSSPQAVVERPREQLRAIAAALAEVDLLQTLSDEVRMKLAAAAHFRLYGPGEVIIRQGAPGASLFVVQRGEVSVRLRREDAVEVEVDRIGPPGCLGEMSLLTGEPRSATVVALGECMLIEIDQETCGKVLAEHPEIVPPISAVVARRQANLARLRAVLPSDQPSASEEEWTRRLIHRIREFFEL